MLPETENISTSVNTQTPLPISNIETPVEVESILNTVSIAPHVPDLAQYASDFIPNKTNTEVSKYTFALTADQYPDAVEIMLEDRDNNTLSSTPAIDAYA